MVFQCINIRQVPWEVLKTATSPGTWRMLMHEKPCLFDPYIKQIHVQTASESCPFDDFKQVYVWVFMQNV